MLVQDSVVAGGAARFEDLLKGEFERRHSKNPSYSLRAFARAMGQDASSISKIFSGKRKVGKNLLKKLADRLNLADCDLESLLDINRFDARRGTNEREYQILTEDLVKTMLDWQHTGVLLLTELADFKPEFPWIAHRLGISEAMAKQVVSRLERMGMLKCHDNGKWETVTTSIATFGKKYFTNEELRLGQLQFLKRAIDALHIVPLEKRDNTTICFSCCDDDLPRIREYITRFRRRLDSLAGESKKKNAVYSMTVSLVPITEVKGS